MGVSNPVVVMETDIAPPFTAMYDKTCQMYSFLFALIRSKTCIFNQIKIYFTTKIKN